MHHPTLDDRSAVLCERCGYALQGLHPQGLCPECGRPIEASLPVHRTGSDWQRERSVWRLPGAWVRTCVAMLTTPHGFWTAVRIERPSAFHLVAANVLVSGVLAASLLTAAHPASLDANLSYFAESFAIVAFAVALLTGIETSGIRFFSRRRRLRGTWDHALAVTSHASIGWVIGAVLAGAGRLLAMRLDARPVFDLPILVGVSPAIGGWMYILPAAGWIIGMMLFEVWSYLGMRRLRYANWPPAEHRA